MLSLFPRRTRHSSNLYRYILSQTTINIEQKCFVLHVITQYVQKLVFYFVYMRWKHFLYRNLADDFHASEPE